MASFKSASGRKYYDSRTRRWRHRFRSATPSFAKYNIGFVPFPQTGRISRVVCSCPAPEKLLRFDQCSESDVLKDGRLEERLAACIPPEFRELPLNRAIAGKHFGSSSYVTGLTKEVPQPCHQPFWRAAVNLRIDTVDVACGPLRPVAPAFKNEDPVLSVRNMSTVKSETRFDRHIESWNPSGRLNTGQVVDGNIRVLDQIRHGEGGINTQPEQGESDNISQIETVECRIVRNIEKDGLDSPRSGHAISLRQNGMPSFGRISSVLRPRPVRLSCPMPFAASACS
jgi:hypothetical protein